MKPEHRTNHQKAPQGTVLAVEHTPTSNREKIHTRILLKGHPLPVDWRSADLHHTSSPELHWKPERCIYCQECSQVCPKGCLHHSEDGLEIDHENCDTCGDCLKECPSMALAIRGEKTTAGDLLHKTLKQNYQTARKISLISITGGEPGWQPAFCADLLFQIEAAGLPSILETSGMAPFENLLPLLTSPQCIHYELISCNDALHTRLTGYGNALILENLLKVCQEITPPTRLAIRTPMIPHETATQEEISHTGAWLAAHVPPSGCTWDLFEPNFVCKEMAAFSGQDWAQIRDWAASSGFPPEQINIIDKNNQLR